MALKNQNIAKANPSSVANKAFIDALYKERYGRYATDAEYKKFSNKTVKDASNIILGQTDSPFSKTTTPAKPRTEADRNATWENAVKESEKKTAATTKTNRRDVIANFNKYLGRLPSTDADWKNVDYMTTLAPGEVESRLKAEGAKMQEKQKEADPEPVESTTSTEPVEPTRPNTPENNAELDAWIKGLIDSGELSTVEGNILSNALAEEYIGADIPTEETLNKILKDAETNAITDLEPYYKEMTSRELEDLKAAYADIRNSSLRYQQTEAKSYAEKLQNTKQSLRARGLTFSGASRATLGKQGALSDEGIEGSVPQDRRFQWEDQMAQYQESARDIGTQAERKLGSAGLSERADFLKPDGLADPYGHQPGTPLTKDYQEGQKSQIYTPKKEDQSGYVKYGDLPLEKKRAIEQEKWERMGLQRTY